MLSQSQRTTILELHAKGRNKREIAKLLNLSRQSVRKVLQLKAGDMLGFEINGDEVKLRRASPLDLAFAQALEGTLPEWASKEDDLAFKSL